MRRGILEKLSGKYPLPAKRLEPFIWCGGLVLFLLVCCTTLLVLRRVSNRSADSEAVRILQAGEGPKEGLLAELKNAAAGASEDSGDLERELAWNLVRQVIARGLLPEAQQEVFAVLPAQATTSATWTQRLLDVARALVHAGKWQEAQQYYDAALESYRLQQHGRGMEQIMRERAVLLAAGCGNSRQERIATLEGWLAQVPAETSSTLGAELRVFLAKLHRSMGNLELADSNLRQVADRQQQDDDSAMAPTLLICRGYAHLALREEEAAVDCLREGIAQLKGDDVTSRMYRALALRDLATISLNLDHSQAALALLERVGAETRDILPSGILFQPEIAGSRGWALYMAHDYEYALALFQRQLEMIPPGEEGLRVYPLEGIARCYLALGRPEEALPTAHESVMLCEKSMPEDKPFLARLNMLLGQANEQAGRLEEAERNYSRAAGIMTGDPMARSAALSACATVLMQEQKWEEAARTWEQELPLIPEQDMIQREDIAEQIEKCRKNAAAARQPVVQTHPPTVTQPPKRTKPTKSSAASSRRATQTRRRRR